MAEKVPNPRSDLVAVIPAYQAEKTIGDVVRRLRSYTERIVVVDDGSKDNTLRCAQEAGAMTNRLETNGGKGVALRRGIELALDIGPEGLILLDADGQHAPEDLENLLPAWDRGESDLLIGCRLEEIESIPGARYWTNYIGSRILTWMSGQELHDSQSGYRIIRSTLVRDLGLTASGYAIETEMLLKAAYLGARITHAKIQTIYNGQESHFVPVRDTVRIALAAIYYKVFHQD